MYRNYDGNKSTFGDTGVAGTVADPDTVAAVASQRSADGALTGMVVSRYLSANGPATINLANFAHRGAAQVWHRIRGPDRQGTTIRRFRGAEGALMMPKAATPFVVPTYTCPLTIVGVMNLFPAPNASRPEAA